METKLTFSEEHTSTSPGRIQRPNRLMAPVVLITLGIMFLLGEYVPALGIGKTWPMLLVVIGITKLIEILIPKRSKPSPEAAKSSSRGDVSL